MFPRKFSLQRTRPTTKKNYRCRALASLPYFVLLSFGGVDDRGAAHLGHFLSVAIKTPATDLFTAGHIFDEEDSIMQTNAQLVEQFDVLH